MGVGMPHDGRWIGERLVFTTTNGYLVFIDDQQTSVDLSELTPGMQQLGWCRGVSADPRCDDRIFVAFTTLRRSRFKEFGYWIKWRQQLPHSRIAHYDLAKRELIATWELPAVRRFGEPKAPAPGAAAAPGAPPLRRPPASSTSRSNRSRWDSTSSDPSRPTRHRHPVRLKCFNTWPCRVDFLAGVLSYVR